MESPEKVDLAEKLARIPETWSPRVVARVGDQLVKLARLHGEFVWHRHAEEDELFLVVKGSLTLHLRDRSVELEEGQLFVVPRGVEHKPEAIDECHVLLVEPASTVNTGELRNERTVLDPDWL